MRVKKLCAIKNCEEYWVSKDLCYWHYHDLYKIPVFRVKKYKGGLGKEEYKPVKFETDSGEYKKLTVS